MNKIQKFMYAVAVVSLVATASVWATAYTNTVGSAYTPVLTQGATYRLDGVVKFADVAYVLNDTVEVFEIPSNSYVVAVQAKMGSVGTNDVSFVVGDATTTNQYITVYSATNTAATASAYTAGLAYPSGGKMIVKFQGTMGRTGVLKVSAAIAELMK